MQISQKGIDLIKEFEGLRVHSYQCQAKVWTIGYGHTKGVKPNQTITEKQAENFLKEDLAEFEKAVNSYVKVDITQSMFDALVSFAFNCGKFALKTSSLLKYVNKREFINASNEFLKWNKYTVGGVKKVSNGLSRRRRAEKELFMYEGTPIEKPKTPKKKTNSKKLKMGDIVKIKKGAKDLNTGRLYANFVYKCEYNVLSVSDNRVVFGIGSAITGATSPKNIKKVK